MKEFADRHPELAGKIEIPGIDGTISNHRARTLSASPGKYLLAIQEAKKIYGHIAQAKGEGHFITEISMDETDSPQTPVELLVILTAIAGRGNSDPNHRAEIHRPV